MTRTGYIVLAVLLLGAITMCSPPDPSASTSNGEDTQTAMQFSSDVGEAPELDADTVYYGSVPAGALTVTIRELEAAYAANEAAAQLRYGEKMLYVTGTVADISLDMDDKPMVSFETDSFLSADLRFDPAHEEEAAALQKGETRTFICTKVSEVMGSPSLDACKLAAG